MKSNEWRMFPECFVLCSTAASSLYTWEPEREALATIPLEWHYLMVGWALSAKSGLRMGGALLGPDPGATQCHQHIRHPGLPKQTLLDGEEGGGGHDRDNEARKQTKDTKDFTWAIMHQTDTHISILSVCQWHNTAVLFCLRGWTEGRFKKQCCPGSMEQQQLSQREENRRFLVQTYY